MLPRTTKWRGEFLSIRVLDTFKWELRSPKMSAPVHRHNFSQRDGLPQPRGLASNTRFNARHGTQLLTASPFTPSIRLRTDIHYSASGTRTAIQHCTLAHSRTQVICNGSPLASRTLCPALSLNYLNGDMFLFTSNAPDGIGATDFFPTGMF